MTKINKYPNLVCCGQKTSSRTPPNIENSSITKSQDFVLVHFYSYFNNFGQATRLLITIQDLKQWLEEQIAETNKEIELESGEGYKIPQGKKLAFVKVLDYLENKESRRGNFLYND